MKTWPIYSAVLGPRNQRVWIETALIFEPRDCWIGVYWKSWPSARAFYVCIIPTLPLYIYVQWFS